MHMVIKIYIYIYNFKSNVQNLCFNFISYVNLDQFIHSFP